LGGMGSRQTNFYAALAGRYGFAEQAATVQASYLARDYEAAMAAVPLGFLDMTSLLGPVERVADRFQALLAVGVTTVNVSLFGATVHERIAQLRACAIAFDTSGVGH
ncbi:MAG: LLM class F420-dependent oxidoreductase, partial [Actinomycetota bacterium]